MAEICYAFLVGVSVGAVLVARIKQTPGGIQPTEALKEPPPPPPTLGNI